MNQQIAESAFLSAKAHFDALMARLDSEWQQPATETAAAMAWEKADPMQKTTLAQYAPDEFDKLQKKLGGKNGKG